MWIQILLYYHIFTKDRIEICKNQVIFMKIKCGQEETVVHLETLKGRKKPAGIRGSESRLQCISE